MKKSNRSTIGVIAAVLLALVGGLLLWKAQGSSNSDATEAAADGVDVLVTVRAIDAGESAKSIAESAYAFVKVENVPADQVLPDALSTLDELTDLGLGRNVVAAAIPMDTQLTLSSFIVPGADSPAALDDVAENLFQMTVALEPQRALGGFVRAGQTVAVLGSFDPAEESLGETVLILEQVEVTNVQVEQLLTSQQTAVDPLAPTLAPNSRLIVTFGVKVEDLERLTYAVEFGRIWLADQGPEATAEGSEVRIRENVVVPLGELATAAQPE